MLDFLNLKEATISDLADKVHIVGIVNSRIITKKYSTGSILQRFGVILPCHTNIILEIWSSGEETKPKFSENWKNLQMIAIFSASYGGETKVDGQYFKVFRLECKKNKNYRFIWLSDENPTFWIDPILQRDSNEDFFADCDSCWPDPPPIAEGILKRSSGSYIAKNVYKYLGHLHTNHFEESHFSKLFKTYEKVRKGVHGVLNIYTGNPTCTNFNFDR